MGKIGIGVFCLFSVIYGQFNLLVNPNFESWQEPPYVNLVPNFHFEEWINDSTPYGWSIESGAWRGYKDSLNVFNGNYSSLVVVRTTSNLGYFYDIPVSPGETLWVRVWTYALRPSSQGTGSLVSWYTSTGSFISSSPTIYAPDTLRWTRIAYKAGAPANAAFGRFRIRGYRDNGVAGYFDRVVVYKSYTSPPLLDETPTGWHVEGYCYVFRDDVWKFGGDYALGIATTDTLNRGVFQDIPCTPGQNYTYSGYLYGLSPGGIGIGISFYDAQGQFIEFHGPAFVSEPNTWEFVNLEGTVPEGAAYARVRVRGYRDKDLAGFVDNLSFTLTTLAFPCGDFNGDYTVDFNDLYLYGLWLYLGGSEPVGPVDVNGDSQLNDLDLIYFSNYLLRGGPTLNCP